MKNNWGYTVQAICWVWRHRHSLKKYSEFCGTQQNQNYKTPHGEIPNRILNYVALYLSLDSIECEF